MKRVSCIMAALVLAVQPVLADGLTAKARQAIAAKNGGAFDDPDYDAATTARLFQVSAGPSSLPPGQVNHFSHTLWSRFFASRF